MHAPDPRGSEFTPLEDRFFQACLDPAKTRRLQRKVLVMGGLALPCPLAIGYFTQSWAWVAGFATFYMAITTWEKHAFGNGVLAYKSVARKLLARLEEREATDGGVIPPDDSSGSTG